MLSLAERELISRGIVASHPIRSIATSLGRAPSTSVVRSSVTVTDALNNQFLHPTMNGRMAFPAGSHQIQKATPKDGRCMSEFGGRTDVQQTRVIAVVVITVLLSSARKRHRENTKYSLFNCLYLNYPPVRDQD